MRQSICTSILLLTCVALNGVWAQVPYPGKCPEVKIMDTFDLEAYLGIWFENSKYPFAFELGKKCIYAKYELGENNTVSVLNAAINRLTNTPSNITGTAKVIAPAQLAVVFNPNQPSDRANYLVLGTDYKTYSVVYSCTEILSLGHLKSVWILTRERVPENPETVQTALKILDRNNISRNELIKTLQKSCPSIEGNATQNENALGNAIQSA